MGEWLRDSGDWGAAAQTERAIHIARESGIAKTSEQLLARPKLEPYSRQREERAARNKPTNQINRTKTKRSTSTKEIAKWDF